MNAYLNNMHKMPINDPKYTEVNEELYQYVVKPTKSSKQPKSLATKRPMSPELQNCVKAIIKYGVELFNALVFCISERELNGKMPQETPEPTDQPKKRDNRGRREHRDDRKRSTLKPTRPQMNEVVEPEHEEVHSIYDRVLLTIGLW